MPKEAPKDHRNLWEQADRVLYKWSQMASGVRSVCKRREDTLETLSRRDAVKLVALAASPWVASLPLTAQEAALAIKGYDPVAYFTVGKPMKGGPEFAHDWDEQRYHFSSTQHRDLFKADPLRYAPQFANFCAISLSRGKVVEADPENWLVADGKLYIFGLPIGPGLFHQALAENEAKANANRGLIQKR